MFRKVMRILKAPEVQTLKDLVDVDDDVMGGQPCLRGTRVPISTILGEIADGQTVDEIAEDRDLDVEDLKGILHATAKVLEAVMS